MAWRWAEEGKLLGELIDSKFESRGEFARLLKVSDDIVTNLVIGRTRLTGDRKKLALRILGTDERSLRGVSNPQSGVREPKLPYQSSDLRPGTIPVNRAGRRYVPIYGSVPAGEPGRTFSQAVSYEEMMEWGGDFERWGRIISGDSMLPDFEDGDIVIFENRRPEDNQAVYATREGEDAFKILRRSPTGMELWPINPNFEPFSAEDWVIHGVCIYRIRLEARGERAIRDYPAGKKHTFA